MTSPVRCLVLRPARADRGVGAIGALERLLMFNPDLSRARKELGFLYARLGNWELAAQHLRAARDSA